MLRVIILPLSFTLSQVSQLKHVLKKSSSAYGDTVMKGFLMAMVAMLGGYRSSLKMREGDAEVTFDEEM